jgi:hypothetical protein
MSSHVGIHKAVCIGPAKISFIYAPRRCFAADYQLKEEDSMSETMMQEMTLEEVQMASGGNGRDTATGSFVSGNATACANTILFWGSTGAGIGSMSSGIIGFFAGAAFGGYLGIHACRY